jgi:hypothetical protein
MASRVVIHTSTNITFHLVLMLSTRNMARFAPFSEAGSFNIVHSDVRGAQGFQLCFILRWSRSIHQCLGPKVVRQRVTAGLFQFITHLLTSVNAPLSVLMPALRFDQSGGGCAGYTNCDTADALYGPFVKTTAYALLRVQTITPRHIDRSCLRLSCGNFRV